MTSYIDTKIVCLTSQSAPLKLNGSFMSNVKYNLGAIIRNDKDIIHRQVQLLNAQIPYSFYVINYTNNLFRFSITTSPAITITVPVGNYTANSLISTLKSLVDTINGDTTFTATIDSINGKMTFTYQYDWKFYNNFTYSIGNVLGFKPDTVYSNVYPFDPAPIFADYPLNLLGIKTLQVRSSNLIMNNISSVEGGATTLLQSIPVSAVPFGMIDFVDKGQNLITIHNDFLDDLDIEIIDGESGEYINFNNQDWCITLAFHLTRETYGFPRAPFPIVNNLELPPTASPPTASPTNPNLNDLELLSK